MAEKVMDGVTVAASGNEKTDAVSVQGRDEVVLFVQGDANSDNLTIQTEAKAGSNDNWHDLNGEAVSTEDLTGTDNNAKAYRFNVEGISHSVRWDVANGGASGTVLTVRADRSKEF